MSPGPARRRQVVRFPVFLLHPTDLAPGAASVMAVLGTNMLLPALASLGATQLGFKKQRSPASRMQEKLRPISYSLRDFSRTKVRALDLEQTLEELEKPKKQLTGRWKKDKELSDPMDEACDLVQLPWVFRKAVTVLDILEVQDSPDYFETNLKAGGIMDVVERYPWTGEAVAHPRRDKRRGRHTAYVTMTDGGPCIVCKWDDPYGGDCTDTFSLSSCGSLLTQSTSMSIRATGRSTQYKTVFRRQR